MVLRGGPRGRVGRRRTSSLRPLPSGSGLNCVVAGGTWPRRLFTRDVRPPGRFARYSVTSQVKSGQRPTWLAGTSMEGTWQAKRAGPATAVSRGLGQRGVAPQPGRTGGLPRAPAGARPAPAEARLVAQSGVQLAPAAARLVARTRLRLALAEARSVAPRGLRPAPPGAQLAGRNGVRPALAGARPVAPRGLRPALALAGARLAGRSGLRLAPAGARPVARAARRLADLARVTLLAGKPRRAVPAPPARCGPPGLTGRSAVVDRAPVQELGRGRLMGPEGLVRLVPVSARAARAPGVAVQPTATAQVRTGPGGGPGRPRTVRLDRERGTASRGPVSGREMLLDRVSGQPGLAQVSGQPAMGRGSAD